MLRTTMCNAELTSIERRSIVSHGSDLQPIKTLTVCDLKAVYPSPNQPLTSACSAF